MGTLSEEEKIELLYDNFTMIGDRDEVRDILHFVTIVQLAHDPELKPLEDAEQSASNKKVNSD